MTGFRLIFLSTRLIIVLPCLGNAALGRSRGITVVNGSVKPSNSPLSLRWRRGWSGPDRSLGGTLSIRGGCPDTFLALSQRLAHPRPRLERPTVFSSVLTHSLVLLLLLLLVVVVVSSRPLRATSSGKKCTTDRCPHALAV